MCEAALLNCEFDRIAAKGQTAERNSSSRSLPLIFPILFAYLPIVVNILHIIVVFKGI